MSTQLNTYVMYGVLFDYNEVEDLNADKYGFVTSTLTDYTDNAFKADWPKPIMVLEDGMNGEYIAVGHVIAKSGNWEGFTRPVVISPEGSLTEPILTRQIYAFLEKTGLKWPTPAKFSWRVISHYR